MAVILGILEILPPKFERNQDKGRDLEQSQALRAKQNGIWLKEGQVTIHAVAQIAFHTNRIMQGVKWCFKCPKSGFKMPCVFQMIPRICLQNFKGKNYRKVGEKHFER